MGETDHGHGDRPCFQEVIGNLSHLLTNRPAMLSLLCVFFSATPVALMGSVLPAYLAGLGYRGDAIGFFSGLLAATGLAAGLLFPSLEFRLGSCTVFVVAMVGLAVVLGSIPAVSSVAPITFALGLAGLFRGLLEVLQHTIVSAYTPVRERGSAIGVVGLGVVAAQFMVPLLVGLSVRSGSFSPSFLALGFFFMAVGIVGQAAVRTTGRLHRP